MRRMPPQPTGAPSSSSTTTNTPAGDWNAAGSGNVAVTAARTGATVVASDLTPELFEAGRARAAAEGVELEERAFSVDDAKRAREVFVTAASSFVMPLVSLDGVRIGDGRPGPVATRLRELYLEQARREAI